MPDTPTRPRCVLLITADAWSPIAPDLQPKIEGMRERLFARRVADGDPWLINDYRSGHPRVVSAEGIPG